MDSAIKSLLIANRGEIAVRIARTAREMGIRPIGVFAEEERDAHHVSRMAQAASLGSGSPARTYLSIAGILEAARETGADAVHPGYGFLSENAEFARAVESAGLLWIGPPASAIEEMGDKLRARARMRSVGVPVIPGSDGPLNDGDLAQTAERVGFPLLVKAAAGGGGKGMARVERPEDLAEAVEDARRVSAGAFGDDRVYLERFFERARHIEFQVFGDRYGSVVHLFERECSVQRRHQKIVEETPSAALDPRLREAMGRAAVEAARAVGYVGAGTIEFLLDERKNFYFLEMNTRLQVEHPITEETLGLDLVRSQLEVAGGEPLPSGWRGGKLVPQGHAIELRLYAEDPVDFLPRSGEILLYEEPSGPGVRVDSGVTRGSRVLVEYDPLLAKLVVSGPTRAAAIERGRRALADWVVLGVETNLPRLDSVLASEEFAAGRYATDLVGRLPPPSPGPTADAAWIAAALLQDRSSRRDGRTDARDPWDAAAGWRIGG